MVIRIAGRIRVRSSTALAGIGSQASPDCRRGERLLRELAHATGGTFVYCSDVQEPVGHYRRMAERKACPGIVTVCRH